LRWSVRAIRIVLTTAALGALALVAVRRGLLPAWSVDGAWVLLAVALMAGLGAVFGAVRGYRASNAGRPGPAVEGVIPLGTALSIGAIGMAPTALGVVLLFSR
jgi:hypothetical protein